jgi:hypothetical protein
VSATCTRLIRLAALPRVILVGGFSIAAAASAHCEDFACPKAPPARVQINATISRERVDADMSLQQLREAAEGHHPGPIVGMYVGSLRYGVEIDDTVQEEGSDRFCATPKYVTLTIQLDRDIHIPREFSGDPCLVALARDHEAKHADADTKALDRSRPLLLSAIRAAVDHDTVAPGGSRAEALDGLTAAIQTAVEHTLDDMAIERRSLDAAVDSPAELERLKTGCDGRAGRWMSNPV